MRIAGKLGSIRRIRLHLQIALKRLGRFCKVTDVAIRQTKALVDKGVARVAADGGVVKSDRAGVVLQEIVGVARHVFGFARVRRDEHGLIEQGERGLFAKFQHTGLDDFIFFPEESAGTQRFIEIFPRLHYALETGSIAVVDEIDTDLHPLLLPELFWWFSSLERNPHGAQLLFTAHNPALLDKLQKEQVFFTEKPCGQSTRVYGARDIKGLRREPSLMKKYLSGELGAVPHIG